MPGFIPRQYDFVAEYAVLGKEHDPLERSDRVEAAQIGVQWPRSVVVGRGRAHRCPSEDAELAGNDAQITRRDLSRPGHGLLHDEIHVLPDREGARGALRRRSEDPARSRSDLGPFVHVSDQFRNRAGLDHRPGVELIAKLGAQLGADPLEEQRMGMKLAAIFVFHADGEIDFARQIAGRSKADHHLIDAPAREMDGLAERSERAPGVDNPNLGEKLHDLRVDPIAPVSDDDDARSRRRPGRRRFLAADA